MSDQLNWDVVTSNLSEALEELQRLADVATDQQARNEVELQFRIEHVYHHLNVAWNARHATHQNYNQLTQDDFNLWGRFPTDVDLAAIDN